MIQTLKNNCIFVLCAAAVIFLFYRIIISEPEQVEPNQAVPNVLLEQGWDRFANMDSQTALLCFHAVMDSANASEAQRQQAHYGLILTHEYFYPDAQPHQALALIEKFRDTHPDSELLPWVLLEKGYILHRTSADPQTVRTLFEHIIDTYPHSEAIHEAALALAHSRFTARDANLAQRGIDILKDHLQKYPDSELERILLYRLSYRLAETNQDYVEALPYAEKLGEMMMCDPFRWGMQFWLVAQIYNRELNDPEKAIYWYNKIIEKCDHDQRMYSAKQMIEKLQNQ